jgi:hypothetical protein
MAPNTTGSPDAPVDRSKSAPQIDLLINGVQALALLFPKGHAPTPLPGWTRAALTWRALDGQVVVQQDGHTVGLLPLASQPHLAQGRTAILVEWDADAQQAVEKGTATLTAG